MKLLVDMNLSPRWVGVLAGAGLEAAHWSTLGANNARDSEIMDYASANDFVVLTHDLDFSAILAATHGERPSIVQIRAEDVSPEAIGKQVINALRQMEFELQEGALITLNGDKRGLSPFPRTPRTRPAASPRSTRFSTPASGNSSISRPNTRDPGLTSRSCSTVLRCGMSKSTIDVSPFPTLTCHLLN